MSCQPDELDDLIEIRAVLREYHKRLLLENLAGPGFSLVVHITVLGLLLALVIGKKIPPPPTFEVDPRVHIFEPDDDDPVDPPDTDSVKRHRDVDVPGPDIPTPKPDPDQTPTTNITPEIDPVAGEFCREKFKKVDPVEMNKAIARLPIGFRPRGGPKQRAEAIRNGGGDPPVTEAAVERALAWLKQVQGKNGSWGPDSPAHTGMALLVFLGHGETPLSETYGLTVQMGLRWLCRRVMETASGDLGQRAYGHGMATYALAEAWAMTRLPNVKEALDRALAVLLAGQQNGGGFNYDYARGDRWDLSVSGWQNQALKAAAAGGVRHEDLPAAIRRATLFCRRTYRDGKFGYCSPGSGGNMTGVGAVSLQLLDTGAGRQLKGAIETIGKDRLALLRKVKRDPALWDDIAGKNLYGWYYDTQAMYNARLKANGDRDPKGQRRWQAWRPAFEDVLLTHQQPAGYWEVAKGHGLGRHLKGRIMATCWAALQLEVYYKMLPTFDTRRMNEHKRNQAAADIEHPAAGNEIIIEIQ